MAYLPDKKAFLEKARHGNLVPVWRELIADQDTPVSAYERLRQALRGRTERPYTFLLESVEGGEKVARYSFLGGDPCMVLRSRGRDLEIEHRGGRIEKQSGVEPLAALQTCMARFKPVPDPALPRFFGGAVGYIGYDTVSLFEPRVPESG
ncbi:MAG TPA: anthranilate synthase component I, partial [Kiritimatiellia bacterium]